MTHVLAFQCGKGGTGKSSLACHVAAYLARKGNRVLLLDADPQGNLLDWAKVRGDHPNHVEVRQVAMSSIERVVDKVKAANAVDWIIIDTPPHTEAIAAASMRAADLILVPCQPSRFDVVGLKLTHELAKNARIPDDKFAVVMNRTPTHFALRLGVAKHIEVVKKLYNWTTISSVGHREWIKNACDSGVDIGELEPNGRGARELRLLIDRITKKIKGGK